jgi:hypothetical protein
MRLRSALIMLTTWGLLPTLALPAAEMRSLPTPSGSYGIGRVSYELTDPGRPERLSSNANARRRMMAYVWYPIDRRVSQGKANAPYLPFFDEVKSKLRADDIADMFRPAVYDGTASLPTTHVVENAPMPAGGRRFPLLLFAHGWGNPTFLYTAELEDIVSHGYVIAAIEHPYDTVYTRFSDGDVTFFAQDRFNKETARQPHGLSAYSNERVEVMSEDNHYALTALLKYADTEAFGAPFYRRIDSARIGAFGHSIGGLTAARTCQIDQRVKACMDQDSADYRGSPFIVSSLEQTESQPFFLFVVSSADIWSAKALNPSDADLAQQKLSRAEFDAIMRKQQEDQTNQMAAITGGSYRLMLFDLPGFIHRSFTDQTLLAASLDHDESIHNFRIAETYTLSFFDKYLRDDTKTVLDIGKPADARVTLEKFPKH